MKKKLKNALVCLLLLSSLLVISSCKNKSTTEDSSVTQSAEESTLLSQIKEKGVLTIGTASGYPPYEFIDIDSADQAVTGIDIALAQAIASELDVKLKVVDMSFGGLLASLATGKIDIAIAGINPTEERKKTVDFSDIYVEAEQKVLINKSDATKFSQLSDFYGKNIGAEKSTSQESLANAEITDANVVALDKVPGLILELKNNKIDGIVVESIVGEQYILSDNTLIYSDATFANSKKNTAIALPKNNADLLKIVNKVIADKKADGSFDKWIIEYSKLVIKQSEQ